MKRNILFVVLGMMIIALGALSYYYHESSQKNAIAVTSLKTAHKLLSDSLQVIHQKQSAIIELIDSLMKAELISYQDDNSSSLTIEHVRESLYQLVDRIDEKENSLNKLQTINFQFAKDLIAEKKKSQSLDSIYNKESFVWQQQKNNFLTRLEREEMTKQTLQNSRDSILASFGKLVYKNVAGIEVTYVGNKVHNKAEGFGIGLYSAKGTYVGMWHNGRRHGEGMYKWLNGDKYEGRYYQGTREGFGIYYFSDGSRFEGEWKNDKRNGEGVFYSADNKVLAKGTWKDDKRLNVETIKKPILPEDVDPA
jgi:hypothetical protein